MFRILILALVLFSALTALAQNGTVNNRTIIEMSKAGLSADLILKKVASSRTTFDVSAASLIELKGAGVDDNVIAAMMDHINDSPPVLGGVAAASADGVVPSADGVVQTNRTTSANSPPVLGGVAAASADGVVPSDYSESKDALVTAKTIAFGKSSVQPSRQALEKELLRRKDFQQLNLTILRYKEAADLFVDIGFVSGSVITHRYVYRIYDRRTGAVISAGETTSWGSLAENLARHIAKSLAASRLAKAI